MNTMFGRPEWGKQLRPREDIGGIGHEEFFEEFCEGPG